MSVRKCRECGLELPSSKFEKTVNGYREVCRRCRSVREIKRNQCKAIERKLELIKSREGKCEMCGYEKCLAALEFHHINPTQKVHRICYSLGRVSNKEFEKIKEERDGCLLLCANCHREMHHLGNGK
jgi:hypothetical protein